MNKFILLSLIIASSSCFAFEDYEQGFQAIKIANENLKQTTNDVKKLNTLTFFNKYPSINDVEFVLHDWTDNSSMEVEMHRACKLRMDIMPNGFVRPNFGNPKEYSTQNLIAYNRLILLHEFAHCEYALLDKFYLEGMSKDKMNRIGQIFDITKNVDGRPFITDLARLQMENFADILGIIMFLKMDGDTPETQKAITMLLKERALGNNSWQHLHSVDKVPYSINRYDCYENIERVLQNKTMLMQKSPDEIKALAIQWASEHVTKVMQKEIVTFRKKTPYNLDTAIALEQFQKALEQP